MKTKSKKILGLGLLTTALGLGFYIDRQCFVAKENKISITNKKLTGPIKITQISDFHSNALKNLDEVLAKIANFNPDFIVLTGDILDYGTTSKIKRSEYFLDRLSKLGIKTYYITGNHEEVSPRLDEFFDILERFGIIYLNNEGVKLNIRGEEIYLYGTSMYNFSYENFKASKNSVNIVLSHYSKNVRDNYRGEEDLILSGHTHGGQVRAPFIGALLAPGEGVLPTYDKGIYPYRNSTIHIDSGLGNTFLPLRFLDQIQYTNLTLAPVV